MHRGPSIVKNLKTLGIAGGMIAAAVVGGTLISAALAAPSSPNSNPGADLAVKAAYCDTWQKAFADELGVSVDDLLPAAKVASNAAIDAAVAAGDMTAERAAALKAKIAAADGSNACRFFGHPFVGAGHGPKAHFGGPLLSVAAEALGMDPGALMQALRSGDSLQDVATTKKKDYAEVTKAILDAAKTQLDTAVTNGLDQARADELLSKLDDALASGDFPQFIGRGHSGFGHGDADESPEESSGS